jgi:hypothetical protein
MTAPRIPLNTFKLLANKLTSGSNQIYLGTTDVSTIILSAQITNVSEEDHRVSARIEKTLGSPFSVTILNNGLVPPNESLNPLSGKVVLEKGDRLVFITDTDNVFESILSVLENANN